MSNSEKPKTSCWECIKNYYISIDGKCKPIERCFEQCAILNILEHLGRPAAFLTIIAGMAFYMIGCPERQMQAENQRRATHYQAWQIIESGMGQRSSSGRVVALQDLNKDKVSLAGIDISNAYLLDLNLDKANLSEAILTDTNLPGAILSNTNLTKARLNHAGLAEADLTDTNLTGATLMHANLSKAILTDANLTGVDLLGSDFTGANLKDANLIGVDLNGVNFSGADLSGVNLAGAILWGAYFTGADLRGANLTNITGWQPIESIEQANIYDVRNPPDGFQEWALEHGAVEFKNEKEWIEYKRKKKQEQTKEK